jgi:predicted GH43/DUF377 family glycosyl hydrolase
MRKLLICSFIFCSCLLVGSSSYALVHFDFEQKFLSEPGVAIKDHSLVRIGSTYHLFYLRGNPAINFGHATSTDLIHWHIEEPVLNISDSGWDELALWAPHVLRINDAYWMFFTGVNSSWAQQTGVAISLDLFNWSKIPFPLYHPDPSWAEWSEDAWSHGRDPFIFSYNGKYYMLVTAKTNTNKGAIACAVSNDLIHWQDIEPLYVHDIWHVLESVQLIQRNGKFHLFFTEEVVNGTSHMMSDSLFSGWNIDNRTILDDGHAAEVNEFDGNYLISRHTVYNDNQGGYQYVIVLDTLRWSGDLPYVYQAWPLGNNWNMLWGNAFIYQPTYGNNPYARGDSLDINFEGSCWIGTYERYQGPLKYGSPGAYQGDGATGMIRSKPFTVSGNSMNLLVGGGNYPDACYVKMVDASTGQVLFKETGKNTDHMDRRYWDLTSYKGRTVYIEIADLSSSSFGHINCDDITESMEVIKVASLPSNPGSGGRRNRSFMVDSINENSPAILYQNAPNPFNPTTSISYYLPTSGRVVLEIYDVTGKSVLKLVDKIESEGRHEVLWNGLNNYGQHSASGIYFYRLNVDGSTIATRKMVLIK